MHAIAAFLRDERGSHTIEFCIWIPLFVFFLAAAIDASLIYLTHTEMWNAARDTARRITTGQLDSSDEAEWYARNELVLGGRNYVVSADVVNNEAVVRIRTFIADASVFGIFGLFGSDEEGWVGSTLDVRVVMRMEPEVT